MIGQSFRGGSESVGCVVASGAALSCSAHMMLGAFRVDSTILAVTLLTGSGSF
jgi:hypothetical protein